MKILRSAGLIVAFALMFGSVAAQKTELSLNGEIEKFTKEIARHPYDADAYLSRGRAYVIQSSFDLAAADFTKAMGVSTHPYYLSQALIGRGEAYMAQGKHSLAILDFGKIIEMKTAAVYKAQAHRNRADAYHRNGDDKTALADIDKAVAMSSKTKTTGWKERLAKTYELRAAINCGLGNTAAAAADEKKLAGLGLMVSDKCNGK